MRRIHHHSVYVQFNSDDHPWWFTGAYGQDGEKVAFLDELWDVRSMCAGPWCIEGDFNMIYSAEDKSNDNFNRAMMGRFQRFVNDFELKEIPLLGRRYTWSNEGDTPTLVKLDRVLCTNVWEALYPDYILQSQATDISDHCPLVLGLTEGIHGKRRFHFESFWTKLPGFHDVIQTSWNETIGGSCPIERVSLKLKRLTHALQSWSQQQVGHIKTEHASSP